MNLHSFIIFSIVISFTPGPNNILCMTFGREYGYKTALKYIAGVATGFFTLFIATVYFNELLFSFFPQLNNIMKYAGALFLLYLTYLVIYSDNNFNTEVKKFASFPAGFIFQFINPKGLLAALTVSSNFLLKNNYEWNVFLITGLFLAAMAFSATSTWALGGSIIRKFLEKYSQQFNFIMGLMLIYSALTILGVKWS